MIEKNLIKQLKENDEDYNFYPTSKSMIKTIFNHINNNYVDILDIGCGTCNFKNYFNELSEEKYNYEQQNNILSEYQREIPKKKINNYFVIEKSKILINKLDKDSMILGTDFYETNLIDKPVGTIFCNPPYDDFKNWMYKIIDEGNCYDMYLIVPQRWKEDTRINDLITKRKFTYEVLDSTDFLNAERQARAKVDILHITKKVKNYRNDSLDSIEKDSFSEWFNEEFPMSREEIETTPEETIKNELVNGEDKTEILVNLYNSEITIFNNHFKSICSLDLSILETIGIDKSKVMKTIQQKTKSLKILYWKMVFEQLDEITTRLTTETRRELFEKFTECHAIDFNKRNIYAIIVWVIKNSNDYYNKQLISFYKELSDKTNVTPFKSNQKLFENDEWRWNSFSTKATHYTLDYRIICNNRLINVKQNWNGGGLETGYDYDEKISDIKVVFKNIGFEIKNIEKPTSFGEKCYAYDNEGIQMFEFKCHKNGNLHLKLNVEFTKAMNVEVARLLGWIKNKEDIKREFSKEMAKGAEKYFKSNQCIGFSDIKLLQ